MSGCLVASALSMSGESFQLAAKLVLITNVPVAIVEAFVSGFAVYFLMKAKPDFFVSVMQYR
ncbi:hypothetical protein AT251_20125 [Enterovibrio nigricans]|nr:hypothetical protein AT251_20125 [Enterovibrio nigricans]